MKTYKYYTTIDVLWDTLWGTLRKFDEGIALEILDMGYHSRRTNVLSRYHPDIDDNEIGKLWLARDFETFKLSYSTNMFNMLMIQGKKINSLDHDHPDKLRMELVLNVHPYDLSKPFIKTLINFIKEETEFNAVKWVSFPSFQLSPDFIRANNINQIIISNLAELVNIHLSNREVIYGIPFVKCMAPYFFIKEKAHLEKVDKRPLDHINELVNARLRSHIDVQLLDLAEFSLIPPITTVSGAIEYL